ncbi:hypothetical protein B0J17DRAFT_626153 [Rhizoctonia solani]|nr:hypothetical protein B0J17DRAFT_626153 [Rhizoctonia solani]
MRPLDLLPPLDLRPLLIPANRKVTSDSARETAIKPSLGDEKRAKIGLMVMHYITLARVCDGHVKLDSVLTTSGRSFTHKVMRHASLVRTLAFALKVDMTCVYDDSAVPEGLKRLYACISRNKDCPGRHGCSTRRHTRRLDETYCGHRPAGYKPKPKWFGLGGDESTPPVRARDLPRAKSPRAVGVKASSAPNSSSGPVLMARNASDKSSSTSSSGSSGPKSSARKPTIPRCTMSVPVTSRPTGPYEFVLPMAAPPQAAYYAQRAAMAGYYRSMQQGAPSRRMY